MSPNSLHDVVSFLRPLMDGFAAPWCIAGGWAIDLFLGQITRPHTDVELAIFRQDQALLHPHLQGWAFAKIVDGQRQLWRESEWLDLPIHEIHGRSNEVPPRSIEFLLNERSLDEWIFRRNPAVTLPISKAIIQCSTGVPILAPEVVLLYKAKSSRSKDQGDFDSAHKAMSVHQLCWLRNSLAVCDAGHPWLKVIR